MTGPADFSDIEAFSETPYVGSRNTVTPATLSLLSGVSLEVLYGIYTGSALPSQSHLDALEEALGYAAPKAPFDMIYGRHQYGNVTAGKVYKSPSPVRRNRAAIRQIPARDLMVGDDVAYAVDPKDLSQGLNSAWLVVSSVALSQDEAEVYLGFEGGHETWGFDANTLVRIGRLKAHLTTKRRSPVART